MVKRFKSKSGRSGKGRYSKKRVSKKIYSKKRYSKKRYSKKRYSKKRYSKKRYKKQRGGMLKQSRNDFYKATSDIHEGVILSVGNWWHCPTAKTDGVPEDISSNDYETLIEEFPQHASKYVEIDDPAKLGDEMDEYYVGPHNPGISSPSQRPSRNLQT